MIPNILNDEDVEVVIDETVNDKDFEKSDIEIETYEIIEEIKFPKEYEDGGIFILDDINEKELNYTRVQAMFKRSIHNGLSIFMISQKHFGLAKGII